ncbi:MobA-like NTP transferase domain-containing protein [Microdochium trichocladiopsis]|uniref:MobA-like NTP transferase domain-containing protein n=1 Tax=Microdochium trichocladiopsis TaxID=1682393 RepID=A0A9P8XVD9_9PEZI|nr:MobA-like NTP transferase domain-containing protein [Microdochium trichocladiopsis]KAH7018596.1 MobA-like NTP transferase domain-containing protein [Microdochium trichocladiopsis]
MHNSLTSAGPTAAVVLAGGRSTRMGLPKHLLKLPDGCPLYKFHFELIQEACPTISRIYISLASDSHMDEELRNTVCNPHITSAAGLEFGVLWDEESPLDDQKEVKESGGPAKGLLAAWRLRPRETWLVVACDYPRLTADAIQYLFTVYVPPVTYFRNSAYFSEPLISIWSPQALERLARNVEAGMGGPSRTIKELGGTMLDVPTGEDWLYNVNRKEDWDKVFVNHKV